MGPTVWSTYRAGRLYPLVILARPVGSWAALFLHQLPAGIAQLDSGHGLDQEEIPALLSVDHDEAFRKLLQECLNKILLAESTEQLWAQPYKRSEERKDSL